MDILEPQVVLILVGLPGSSKSTFSNALVGYSSSPLWNPPPDEIPDQSSLRAFETKPTSVVRGVKRKWTRVSQDEAPSRRRQEVEAGLRHALARGENVVVDRVNFDPS
jgi:hypothetical protein